MKIVIDISDEDYNFIKKQVADGADGIANPLKICIANGTQLSKEHIDGLSIAEADGVEE